MAKYKQIRTQRQNLIHTYIHTYIHKRRGKYKIAKSCKTINLRD